MIYKREVYNIKERINLYNNFNKYRYNDNNIYTNLYNAKADILNRYYNKQIDDITSKYINQLILQQLMDIDYRVIVDGQKISNAIVSRLFNK